VRRPTLPQRGALTALVAFGLVVGVTACSSSSSDSKSDSTTTKAPEEILVSNAAVTTGLADLGRVVTSAATGQPTKSAGDAAEQQWQKIEGRIKQNDTNAYLAFEDGLSDLRSGAESGDASKVRKGAAAIAAATSAYLAKYPG